MHNIKKYYPSIIFVILIPQLVFGQADTAKSLSAEEPVTEKKSLHALYAGLGTGSNMIYMGSTISQDQPYEYGSIIYGFNDMLYASVSAVHLSERSPFSAFNTASLSFNKTLNSWFDLSVGISGYNVAPSLRDTLFNNFLYTDITLGIDWRILYTKVSAGGLFSGGYEGYYQIRNSRFSELPFFKNDKFSLSLDPYVNLLFGTKTTSVTSDGKTITTGNPLKKNGNKTKTITNTIISNKFGVMEVDLGIPVSFNAGRFSIETEPGYFIPLYDNTESKGFLFTLSVIYRII